MDIAFEWVMQEVVSQWDDFSVEFTHDTSSHIVVMASNPNTNAQVLMSLYRLESWEALLPKHEYLQIIADGMAEAMPSQRVYLDLPITNIGGLYWYPMDVANDELEMYGRFFHNRQDNIMRTILIIYCEYHEPLENILSMFSSLYENPESMFALASTYNRYAGRFEEAVFWFRMAAEQGHIAAQGYLGFMYHGGLGVAQDTERAIYLLTLAAEQGDIASQISLGLFHATSQGVPQCFEQAAYWYRQAALQDIAIAQTNLGRMYYAGQGFEQCYAQAACGTDGQQIKDISAHKLISALYTQLDEELH
jgi:hypothetical protein